MSNNYSLVTHEGVIGLRFGVQILLQYAVLYKCVDIVEKNYFSPQYQHIFKQKVITQKISISEYNNKFSELKF